MSFEDAFHITWLFLVAGLLLAIAIGVIGVILLVVWRTVFGV
jgi:cell division protein FtsX